MRLIIQLYNSLFPRTTCRVHVAASIVTQFLYFSQGAGPSRWRQSMGALTCWRCWRSRTKWPPWSPTRCVPWPSLCVSCASFYSMWLSAHCYDTPAAKLFDASRFPPCLLSERRHAPAPSGQERPHGCRAAAAAELWYTGWSQCGR